MFKVYCQKNVAIIIKHANLLFKVKVIVKVKMTNKVIREKSRCANCMVDKSRFQKQKHNKKRSWNNIYPKLFIH